MTIILTPQSPTAGATDIAIDSNVTFTLEDTVDDTVVNVTITRGANPAEDAILAGVFQSGYAGSITPNGDDLDVVINPTVDFTNDEVVVVDVVSEEPFGSPYSLHIDNLDFGDLGTVDAVNFGDVNWFNGIQNFTVTMLIYMPTWDADQQPIFTKWAGDAVSDQFAILGYNISGAKFFVTSNGGTLRLWQSDLSGLAGFTDATWHRLTVVGTLGLSPNSNRLRVYHNSTNITTVGTAGYPAGALPTSIFAGGTADLRIGGIFAGSSSLGDCNLSSLAIYLGTALNITQVAELGDAVNTDLDQMSFGSPTHWYQFNNDYTDSGSGAHVTGIPESSPTFDNVIVPVADIIPFEDSYSFTIVAAPIIVDTGDAHIKKPFDTIRGGKELVLYGTSPLVYDIYDVDFRGTAWRDASFTIDNSGQATVTESKDGLILSAGPVANSIASIVSEEDNEQFEARLAFKLLAPAAVHEDAVDCLIFEYVLSDDATASIKLRRDFAVSTTALLASTTITIDSYERTVGGAILSTEPDELRIVRCQNYIFLYADNQLLASTDKFSTAEEGTFQIGVGNSDETTAVRARVTSLLRRSHCLIDGWPLLNKEDLSKHRVTGHVPVSSLARVGLVPTHIFGPWGIVEDLEGFEYILPTGRTLGRVGPGRIKFYGDEQLKD